MNNLILTREDRCKAAETKLEKRIQQWLRHYKEEKDQTRRILISYNWKLDKLHLEGIAKNRSGLRLLFRTFRTPFHWLLYQGKRISSIRFRQSPTGRQKMIDLMANYN